MALLNTFFDADKSNTVAQFQFLETVINTLTGQREEHVLSTITPHYWAVYRFDTHCRLDLGVKEEEIGQFFPARFDKLEVGKNTISQREIKLIPDVTNPGLSFVLKDFLVVSTNYGYPKKKTLSYLFLDTNEYGFVLNNGIEIPLRHGEKALEDVARLAPEEDAFLNSVMEQQQRSDWPISASCKADEAVETSVLDDIKAVFDALTDSEQSIISMNELKIIKGNENAQEELSRMVGMDKIKQEIELLEARLGYIKAMQKNGYVPGGASSMHMCFLGAPGTGKTTVARAITGVLSKYGYIKKNKCIEINARQLTGSYIGQTPFRTATIIKAAMGGVLFVDEAYALMSDDYNDQYSAEAVAQLLKQMEDDRGNVIVILAGYDADMQRFLDLNEGMRSRINKYIHFENYSAMDTLQILLMTLRKEHMYITRAALEKVMLIIKKACVSNGFSNGRFARNLYEKILEEHSYYVYKNGIKGKQADTICEETITDRLAKQILDAQR